MKFVGAHLYNYLLEKQGKKKKRKFMKMKMKKAPRTIYKQRWVESGVHKSESEHTESENLGNKAYTDKNKMISYIVTKFDFQ
jgi:hypothetical protein